MPSSSASAPERAAASRVKELPSTSSASCIVRGSSPRCSGSWYAGVSAAGAALSRRPATVTCASPDRAASRSPTASSTCPAAVRPKRASQARGSGSLLTIVPVAAASRMRAPDAFDSVSVSVSSPSSCASSSTVTFTVFSVSPAWKVSVPETAV